MDIKLLNFYPLWLQLELIWLLRAQNKMKASWDDSGFRFLLLPSRVAVEFSWSEWGVRHVWKLPRPPELLCCVGHGAVCHPPIQSACFACGSESQSIRNVCFKLGVTERGVEGARRTAGFSWGMCALPNSCCFGSRRAWCKWDSSAEQRVGRVSEMWASGPWLSAADLSAPRAGSEAGALVQQSSRLPQETAVRQHRPCK